MVIVAIGGSEGGVEAIQTLLGHLPYNTDLEYTFIQHTATNQDTIGLLAGRIEMPVLETVEGLELLPDLLYIIWTTRPVMVAEGGISPIYFAPG